MATVAAVVVNWNLADDTAACIDSLFTAGIAPGRLYVIDNGSTDGSAVQLRQRYGKRIVLIESPMNRGFAGGNNLGIRAALAAGAQWVLLANNDTVVAEDCLTQLMLVAEALPTFRLLGPLILYHDEPRRIWSLGDRALGDTLLTRSVLRNAQLPSQLPAIEPVDYLTACGLLVHHTVFRRIGLLDERHFMYAEDADFCRRAQLAGFRLACATRARMWHKVSRSSGVHHPQARLWRICNQIRFYRRHSERSDRLVLGAFSLARVSLMSANDLLHARWSLLQPTWQGWISGWFGRERSAR